MNETENPWDGCGKYVPTGHEDSICGQGFYGDYIYCKECQKKQKELRDKK